jgi:hypothetical protein
MLCAPQGCALWSNTGGTGIATLSHKVPRHAYAHTPCAPVCLPGQSCHTRDPCMSRYNFVCPVHLYAPGAPACPRCPCMPVYPRYPCIPRCPCMPPVLHACLPPVPLFTPVPLYALHACLPSVPLVKIQLWPFAVASSTERYSVPTTADQASNDWSNVSLPIIEDTGSKPRFSRGFAVFLLYFSNYNLTLHLISTRFFTGNSYHTISHSHINTTHLNSLLQTQLSSQTHQFLPQKTQRSKRSLRIRYPKIPGGPSIRRFNRLSIGY